MVSVMDWIRSSFVLWNHSRSLLYLCSRFMGCLYRVGTIYQTRASRFKAIIETLFTRLAVFFPLFLHAFQSTSPYPKWQIHYPVIFQLFCISDWPGHVKSGYAQCGLAPTQTIVVQNFIRIKRSKSSIKYYYGILQDKRKGAAKHGLSPSADRPRNRGRATF